jgi:hypothetical protein
MKSDPVETMRIIQNFLGWLSIVFVILVLTSQLWMRFIR